MTILNFLTGQDKKRKQTNISTDSPISAPKALGKKTLGRAIMNIHLNQKLDYEMLNKGGSVMKKKKTKMMAIGGMANKKTKMMAKGGIAKGGLTLVGERGPELVNLPKGAMVHSNAESRRMGGNTINVNVSGRVGASDSELRDIAKKIGRMVNTEINRTTSSSTNVRY